MKLSQLSKAANGFERFTFSVKIDHAACYPSHDYQISSFHIETSMHTKANTMQLTIEHIDVLENLMKILQTGSRIELFAGYQKKEELIFLGYLQEVEFITKRQIVTEVHLYAQDVKGLMMLHKQVSSVISKKCNAMISDLLNDAFYKKYVDKVNITPLVSCMNSSVWINGKSDFDLLCQICENSFTTFYVQKDTLFFKGQFTKGKECIEIDQKEGIYEIHQKTSLTNQYGTIQMTTCDGFQQKKKVIKHITATNRVQDKHMKEIMKHTQSIYVNPGMHDLEELQYIADQIENEIILSYGELSGVSVLLPQLTCGDTISIQAFLDDAKRNALLTEVIHHYDEDGYSSEWKASLMKGW